MSPSQTFTLLNFVRSEKLKSTAWISRVEVKTNFGIKLYVALHTERQYPYYSTDYFPRHNSRKNSLIQSYSSLTPTLNNFINTVKPQFSFGLSKTRNEKRKILTTGNELVNSISSKKTHPFHVHLSVQSVIVWPQRILLRFLHWWLSPENVQSLNLLNQTQIR